MANKVLFEKNFRVHFGDCDPQGIVYFAKFFDWAHVTLEDFWTSRPEGWNFWFQNSVFAVPLKHAEADYSTPVRAGEELVAHLRVDRIGETSVSFVTEFFMGGRVACAVKTVHVFVDRAVFKGISVPENVLATFK